MTIAVRPEEAIADVPPAPLSSSPPISEEWDDAPRRPAWLTGPCPSWCDRDDHSDADKYDDRRHASVYRLFTLTAAEPHDGHVADDDDAEPPKLEIFLEQHYRESEPRLWIARDQTLHGWHLTIDEMRRLADLLNTMVDVAEGRSRP
ncbi:MAG TPA: hypothetical protein VE465_10185 [Streptosporangiaceae bacterium]|jgi:hypothetical protein|nr:hypothetical protein [Streptosporangiaceae bacterium]